METTKADDDKLSAALKALGAELGVPSGADVAATMQAFIQARADARKAKNFALGDQIRKRLTDLGVTLEDRPGGKTDWRVG
jgi:cysteinyl-tRNA synthetase